MEFDCTICGKKHDVFTRITLPELNVLIGMNEQEFETRVQVFKDKFYFVNTKQVFFKADLKIQIKTLEQYIRFEVWVKINPIDFIKMAEKLDGIDSSINGVLAFNIPFYKDTKGTNLNIRFKLNEKSIKNPSIAGVESDNPLGVDFRDGISEKKVVEWMKILHHFPSENIFN